MGGEKFCLGAFAVWIFFFLLYIYNTAMRIVCLPGGWCFLHSVAWDFNWWRSYCLGFAWALPLCLIILIYSWKINERLLYSNSRRESICQIKFGIRISSSTFALTNFNVKVWWSAVYFRGVIAVNQSIDSDLNPSNIYAHNFEICREFDCWTLGSFEYRQ